MIIFYKAKIEPSVSAWFYFLHFAVLGCFLMDARCVAATENPSKTSGKISLFFLDFLNIIKY